MPPCERQTIIGANETWRTGMKKTTDRIASYEEFWPYYLSLHSHPLNRMLHVLGTTIGLLCLLLAPFTAGKSLVLAPIAGYGPLWIGHFFLERNLPATLSYPLW